MDFLLENNQLEKAAAIMTEIENSNEFKSDPVFNSNCFIEADQSIKILFLLLKLELLQKQDKPKELMLQTLSLKKRLGDI